MGECLCQIFIIFNQISILFLRKFYCFSLRLLMHRCFLLKVIAVIALVKIIHSLWTIDGIVLDDFQLTIRMDRCCLSFLDKGFMRRRNIRQYQVLGKGELLILISIAYYTPTYLLWNSSCSNRPSRLIYCIFDERLTRHLFNNIDAISYNSCLII